MCFVFDKALHTDIGKKYTREHEHEFSAKKLQENSDFLH